MNRERLEYFRDVMRRESEHIAMSRGWQSPRFDGYQSSVQGLHACGNTACFAGRVAVDPLFHEAGGIVGEIGEPLFAFSEDPVESVATFFGISEDLSHLLVFGGSRSLPGTAHSEFYGKLWGAVNGNDVANKLQLILDGELT